MKAANNFSHCLDMKIINFSQFILYYSELKYVHFNKTKFFSETCFDQDVSNSIK